MSSLESLSTASDYVWVWKLWRLLTIALASHITWVFFSTRNTCDGGQRHQFWWWVLVHGGIWFALSLAGMAAMFSMILNDGSSTLGALLVSNMGSLMGLLTGSAGLYLWHILADNKDGEVSSRVVSKEITMACVGLFGTLFFAVYFAARGFLRNGADYGWRATGYFVRQGSYPVALSVIWCCLWITSESFAQLFETFMASAERNLPSVLAVLAEGLYISVWSLLFMPRMRQLVGVLERFYWQPVDGGRETDQMHVLRALCWTDMLFDGFLWQYKRIVFGRASLGVFCVLMCKDSFFAFLNFGWRCHPDFIMARVSSPGSNIDDLIFSKRLRWFAGVGAKVASKVFVTSGLIQVDTARGDCSLVVRSSEILKKVADRGGHSVAPLGGQPSGATKAEDAWAEQANGSDPSTSAESDKSGAGGTPASVTIVTKACVVANYSYVVVCSGEDRPGRVSGGGCNQPLPDNSGKVDLQEEERWGDGMEEDSVPEFNMSASEAPFGDDVVGRADTLSRRSAMARVGSDSARHVVQSVHKCIYLRFTVCYMMKLLSSSVLLATNLAMETWGKKLFQSSYGERPLLVARATSFPVAMLMVDILEFSILQYCRKRWGMMPGMHQMMNDVLGESNLFQIAALGLLCHVAMSPVLGLHLLKFC